LQVFEIVWRTTFQLKTAIWKASPFIIFYFILLACFTAVNFIIDHHIDNDIENIPQVVSQFFLVFTTSVGSPTDGQNIVILFLEHFVLALVFSSLLVSVNLVANEEALYRCQNGLYHFKCNFNLDTFTKFDKLIGLFQAI
jgi:uncharacterized membrane protein YadS